MAAEIRDEPALLEPCLRLEKVGVDRFRSVQLVANMYGRIYGGQLLANALSAAMLTAKWRPHMMQAFFLSAGDVARDIEIAVERVRDGRRFAHRRVEVFQDGRILFAADVSFHDDEKSPEYHRCEPPRAPPPECLETLEELAERHGPRLSPQTVARLLARTSVIIKPVDASAGILAPTADAALQVWIKPAGPLAEEPIMQYAALAFMSDTWLNAPCLSPRVNSVFDGSSEIISLNHALWLHRRPSLDDWLLYVMESPIVANLRGLARGSLFDRQGRLVATATQEALMKPS